MTYLLTVSMLPFSASRLLPRNSSTSLNLTWFWQDQTLEVSLIYIYFGTYSNLVHKDNAGSTVLISGTV